MKQQKEAAELQEQQALEMQEGEEGSGGGDLEARVRGYLYSKGDGTGY